MKLSPNVGSDRSWVWNVHADYADGEPLPETLAIRFGNSDSELRSNYEAQVDGSYCLLIWTDANLFKAAFEDAQTANAKLGGTTEPESSGGAPPILPVNVNSFFVR